MVWASVTVRPAASFVADNKESVVSLESWADYTVEKLQPWVNAAGKASAAAVEEAADPYSVEAPCMGVAISAE